jgi:hypothetical protein
LNKIFQNVPVFQFVIFDDWELRIMFAKFSREKPAAGFAYALFVYEYRCAVKATAG